MALLLVSSRALLLAAVPHIEVEPSVVTVKEAARRPVVPDGSSRDGIVNFATQRVLGFFALLSSKRLAPILA